MTSEPLILASKSASRRAMLEAAGVHYESIPANVDERAIERALDGEGPTQIAEALAVAKAAAIAADRSNRLVLGSDSLIVVGDKRFDKPETREDAAHHLRQFSGKTMFLHSAAALVCGSTCEWSHVETAQLKVRELSDEFIEHYLSIEWPAVSQTVGCFRIEAMGVQLFEAIEGDQFTVLGMPLIPVLSALRDHGVLIK